jgi:iron complex transport system ATP-binding protein
MTRSRPRTPKIAADRTPSRAAATFSGVLEARELSLAYGRDPVVADLSVRIAEGRVTALVGANASGKSTLLRGLARLLRPARGAVFLDGQAIAALPTREVARRMAVLPQGPDVPEGITVRELVAHGRYPHGRALRRFTREDELAVERALAATSLLQLAERPLDELSGGRRQSAWIAMTLAQEAPIMLLDEPTTYLDMAHQAAVLELLRRLNREEGRTIVMVLHDLNHAARYADDLLAIRDGRLVAAGPPAEVVTEQTVRDVFGLDVLVVEDPATGGPLVVPAATPLTAALPADASPA